MTLDEAIKHCEEVAEKKEEECKWISGGEDAGMNGALAKTFAECASEHRQLAEWLKKLQAYEKAREKMELKADNCPNPEIRYGMRYALYVQEKCLEEVNTNENRD